MDGSRWWDLAASAGRVAWSCAKVSSPHRRRAADRAWAEELARQLSVVAESMRDLSRRESQLRAALALRGAHRAAPACPALSGGGCSCGLNNALADVDGRVAERPWANAHGLVLVAMMAEDGQQGDEAAVGAATVAERTTRALADLEASAAGTATRGQ